jgi:NTP pyrophosphatase (non-canonical NTP hydrolase)
MTYEIKELSTIPPKPRTWQILQSGCTIATTFDPELVAYIEDPSEELTDAAVRTEAPITENMVLTPEVARLVHVALGLMTEIGEFADPLKRHMFYGAPLNTENMDEEIGDMTWYQRVYCAVRKVSFWGIIWQNIRKLRARFPDKFDSGKALNRNLEVELKALRGE